MSVFKKLRNEYVIWHANRVKFPEFSPSIIVRKKAVFTGRVQKVGFPRGFGAVGPFYSKLILKQI